LLACFRLRLLVLIDAIITSASTNCVGKRCTVCGFVLSASQESESEKDEDKVSVTLSWIINCIMGFPPPQVSSTINDAK
jgi:hypothetical protein